MWTEVQNKSEPLINSNPNTSEVFIPDIPRRLLPTALQKNGSTAAVTHSSCTENSLTCGSNGIIPGTVAAAVFIAFLLGLYAILWKFMVSPPKRKHRKVRLRVQHRSSV